MSDGRRTNGRYQRGLTIEQRFWNKVSEGPGGCWLWTACTRNGYGMFALSTHKPVGAHRWAYEAMVSEIPDGLHLDHQCHNADLTCPGGITCEHRRCVNPYHLDPVVVLVNVRRSPAQNASKTKCPAGHRYTEANTRRYSGRRYCVTCQTEYGPAYRARQREARLAGAA